MSKERYIAHVDMDAFFASIEERDNPSLQGKPVIVGADPKRGRGRGVVSACSYEARKFGIHSAMPISRAYRQCFHGVFLPVDMKKYSRVSDEIYGILYDFTPHIETVSIDEAFLDITSTYHLFGTPRKTCLSIKAKIKEKTCLTASVGLAPTKMAAKIASDLGKPDGFIEVAGKGLLDFLRPLEVNRIWGLGKKTGAVLNEAGITTIGQLGDMDVRKLIKLFGENGAHLWRLANGVDESIVQSESEAKSVSNELTFDEDTLDKRRIESAVMALCEKVSDRLRREGIKGRTVTLKIRFEGFCTYTRSGTMCEATNFTDIIFRQAKQLYENFDTKGKKIRLIGVKASNLTSSKFVENLFSGEWERKKEDVHRAVDKIKEKFGHNSIHRGRRFTGGANAF